MNDDEEAALGTNPNKADSDDGLDDKGEVELGSYPMLADT